MNDNELPSTPASTFAPPSAAEAPPPPGEKRGNAGPTGDSPENKAPKTDDAPKTGAGAGETAAPPAAAPPPVAGTSDASDVGVAPRASPPSGAVAHAGVPATGGARARGARDDAPPALGGDGRAVGVATDAPLATGGGAHAGGLAKDCARKIIGHLMAGPSSPLSGLHQEKNFPQDVHDVKTLDNLLLACLLPRLEQCETLSAWMLKNTSDLNHAVMDAVMESPIKFIPQMKEDLYDMTGCFVYFHCSRPLKEEEMKKLVEDIQKELSENTELKPTTKHELTQILRALREHLNEHEDGFSIAWYVGQVQGTTVTVKTRLGKHTTNVGSGTAVFGWLAKWLTTNGVEILSRILLTDDEVKKIAKEFQIGTASVMRVAEPVWIQACRAFRPCNPLTGTNVADMVSWWGHARDGMPPGMIANNEEIILKAKSLLDKHPDKYTDDWEKYKEKGNVKLWAICVAKARLAYSDPTCTYEEKKKRGDCHPRAAYHPGGDSVPTYGKLWELFVENDWSSFCLVDGCHNAVKIDYPSKKKGQRGRIWPRCQDCRKLEPLEPLPGDLATKFSNEKISQGTIKRDYPPEANAVITWSKETNNGSMIKTIKTPANEREPLVLLKEK